MEAKYTRNHKVMLLNSQSHSWHFSWIGCIN